MREEKYVIETGEHDINELLGDEGDSDDIWEQPKHLFSHKKDRKQSRASQNSGGKSALVVKRLNKTNKRNKR